MGYTIANLLRAIEDAEKNIGIFEEAITRERTKIAEYRELIERQETDAEPKVVVEVDRGD